MNQNHNIDIDLFKRKANRVPLSPLTQGIHFLNQQRSSISINPQKE
jgi:hypothetical protein